MPEPLPTPFVVKKGSKARSRTSCAHALAGVGHRDLDIVAGEEAACETFGAMHDFGRDGQETAIRHGVAARSAPG